MAAAFAASAGASAAARGVDLAARLARLDRVARFLDAAWGIPGTRFRFGVDALADVVPVVGQIIPHAVSAYIIWEAWRLGAPGKLIAKMVGNVALDTLMGVAPIAGMVADAFFKANLRNVALLKQHFGQPA
jgi:hypothetical protein